MLETTTGNSGFQEQALKEGVEAWSQRICFELDPPRQRSHAAAGSSNPRPVEGPFSGPGTNPLPFPLSSSVLPIGTLFQPSQTVEMTVLTCLPFLP